MRILRGPSPWFNEAKYRRSNTRGSQQKNQESLKNSAEHNLSANLEAFKDELGEIHVKLLPGQCLSLYAGGAPYWYRCKGDLEGRSVGDHSDGPLPVWRRGFLTTWIAKHWNKT